MNYTLRKKDDFNKYNKMISDKLIYLDILSIKDIEKSNSDFILIKEGLIDILYYFNNSKINSKKTLIIDKKIYDLLPLNLKKSFSYLSFNFHRNNFIKIKSVINIFRLTPFYTSQKSIDRFFEEISKLKQKKFICPILDTSRKVNYEFDKFNTTCQYFFKKVNHYNIVDIKDLWNVSYPSEALINYDDNFMLRGFSLLYYSLLREGYELRTLPCKNAVIQSEITITPNLTFLICKDDVESESELYRNENFIKSYNRNIKNQDFNSLYKLVEFYAN